MRSSPFLKFAGKIKRTMFALKTWNKLHFGKVQDEIKRLLEDLENIQMLDRTDSLVKQEKEKHGLMNKMLLRERML